MPVTAFIHAAGGIGANAVPAEMICPAETLRADAQPIDLRRYASALGIALPRLTSRFAQLAVVGARQCVSQLQGPLGPATPIYLASGLGDVARTDALYYQVMPPRGEMASPAQFATSGNNMAAFCVAQHLGLLSRNFTISQFDLSFEHALQLALDDMADGIAATALVGGVDETTVPREFYVRRFLPAADRPIGEGSAWLVLGAAPAGALGQVLGVRVLSPPSESIADDVWAAGVAAVVRPIVAVGGPPTLLRGLRILPAQWAALRAQLPNAIPGNHQDAIGCLPTAVALAMAGTFAGPSRSATTYVHINGDAAGRVGVIAWRVGCT